MAVETRTSVELSAPGEAEPSVPSPCVAACKLNAEQICTGCYRHIDEVVAWKQVGNARRRQILLQVEQRKAQLC